MVISSVARAVQADGFVDQLAACAPRAHLQNWPWLIHGSSLPHSRPRAGRWLSLVCAARGRELELRGWVRNTEDGEVEVVAAGEPGDLDELRTSLRRGPRGAASTASSSTLWTTAKPRASLFPDRRRVVKRRVSEIVRCRHAPLAADILCIPDLHSRSPHRPAYCADCTS